jgi:hypothetical protein
MMKILNSEIVHLDSWVCHLFILFYFIIIILYWFLLFFNVFNIANVKIFFFFKFGLFKKFEIVLEKVFENVN